VLRATAGDQGAGDDEVVGPVEDRVEFLGRVTGVGAVGRSPGIRLGPHHLHAHPFPVLADAGTDGAEADDAEGVVGEFAAGVAIPFAGVLLADPLVDAPLEDEQVAKHLLAHLLGVDAGTVRERDPTVGERGLGVGVDASVERLDPP
jgi:hypothetical protein